MEEVLKLKLKKFFDIFSKILLLIFFGRMAIGKACNACLACMENTPLVVSYASFTHKMCIVFIFKLQK